MRKIAVPVVGALAATAAMAVPAIADSPSQTVLTAKASVSNNNAGTKKKPQAVSLKVSAKFATPAQFEPPIVQKARVRFPKGALYNGAKYPKCSQSTLNRKGPSGCPKGSIMGKGSGNAFADTVITKPKIVVVNGGANKVFLFTTLTSPARVATAVPGTIKKIGGKFSYQLDLTVPQSLQVVAGVPIQLRDIAITAGSSKKDWLATTSCPSSGKWDYDVVTSFDNGGDATFASTLACKK